MPFIIICVCDTHPYTHTHTHTHTHTNNTTPVGFQGDDKQYASSVLESVLQIASLVTHTHTHTQTYTHAYIPTSHIQKQATPSVWASRGMTNSMRLAC